MPKKIILLLLVIFSVLGFLSWQHYEKLLLLCPELQRSGIILHKGRMTISNLNLTTVTVDGVTSSRFTINGVEIANLPVRGDLLKALSASVRQCRWLGKL